MPLIIATQYYAPISARLLLEGISASTIRSGWGASQAGGQEILLEVEFTTHKNEKSEADILTLTNDIAAITGTTHRQTVKNPVTVIVPATPLPMITPPSTLDGTDLLGKISVGNVGTTPIVLTFGAPYAKAPVVAISWSSNLCTVKAETTVSGITFTSNNNQINGKTISYICA